MSVKISKLQVKNTNEYENRREAYCHRPLMIKYYVLNLTEEGCDEDESIAKQGHNKWHDMTLGATHDTHIDVLIPRTTLYVLCHTFIIIYMIK